MAKLTEFWNALEGFDAFDPKAAKALIEELSCLVAHK
jgi:hypothetical protein